MGSFRKVSIGDPTSTIIAETTRIRITIAIIIVIAELGLLKGDLPINNHYSHKNKIARQSDFDERLYRPEAKR